jgi:uncharacterized protein (TIGR00730 family)
LSRGAIDSICVFCGSSAGHDQRHAAAAREFGAGLARRGMRLVYGGGQVGLMGIVADAALAAGGEVVGVIPRLLNRREVAHEGLTRLEVVESLAERKLRMGALSDAYVSLPGGIGTLDELFEAWSWSQLGIEAKPNGLLNVAGYFDPLLAFLDDSVKAGFLRPQHRALLTVEETVDSLLDRLSARASRS